MPRPPGPASRVLAIKRAVRARDGLCCTECGMSAADHVAATGRALEVHRIVPGSPYSIEGCVTLCRRCHSTKPRRPYRSIPRVKEVLAVQLDILAGRRNSNITVEVNRAVRELLQREGLWPKDHPPADD